MKSQDSSFIRDHIIKKIPIYNQNPNQTKSTSKMSNNQRQTFDRNCCFFGSYSVEKPKCKACKNVPASKTSEFCEECDTKSKCSNCHDFPVMVSSYAIIPGLCEKCHANEHQKQVDHFIQECEREERMLRKQATEKKSQKTVNMVKEKKRN